MTGLDRPDRFWSALAIWLAIGMSVIDSSIANVALPSMANQLQAAPADSIWIVNAYQLAALILLLPMAAIGDRVGHRRIYLGGLLCFVIGSFGCGISTSLNQIIAARVVQGLGSSAILSMNGALVRATYPPTMLGRGIGLNALVFAASAAAGPSVATLILNLASWHWLFLINIPFGVLSFLLGVRFLPRVPGHGGRFDWRSALLSGITFGLLVVGLDVMARTGIRQGIVPFVAGIVAATTLVRRDWSRSAPLLPFDLLRHSEVGLSIAASVTAFSAQMVALVVMPFLLLSILSKSVTETGLIMTIWPVALGVAAPFAGRLSDRYSPSVMGSIGLALFAAGLFVLSTVAKGSNEGHIIIGMMMAGLGFGFFQSPNNRIIVGSAPAGRTGAAGGMLATSRILGQTIGAASVAAGFNLGGIAVISRLLITASIVAALAATIGAFRLRPRPKIATLAGDAAR